MSQERGESSERRARFTPDKVNCRCYNRRVEISLISGPPGSADTQTPENGLVEAQQRLRRMVLDSVLSPNSRRNYAKAIDDLFALSAGRPLTRALLMEYRASMEALAPSTINVRLSAVRKLVAEARQNGLIGVEDAASLSAVPNIRQKGTRMGNWLTREQAKGAAGRSRSLDSQGQAGLRDPGAVGRLCTSPAGAGHPGCRDHPASGGPLGAG